jgi:regulator of protease activity HflC (stomatin/prohibitin superfamily)
MTTTMWVTLGAAVTVLGFLVRRYLKAVTILEYERGLRYQRGRFVSVLGAGRYWINPITTRIDLVDARRRSMTVPGQEVLSADGVTLKVSLAVQYSVSDPARAVNTVQDFQAVLYQELQLSMRGIIGSSPIEEVLERRAEFGTRLRESVVEKATEAGLDLSVVEVKDIMFPGELKKIFAEVVKARQEGLAALERARGETAALRKLANAAELLGSNPALMTLRSLQALADSPNATLVLGAGAESTAPG